MRKPLILVGFSGVVALGLISAWGLQDRTTAKNDTAALKAIGQNVYTTNCAACHGPKGGGASNWRERKPNGKLPAPPLDGSGHTWHHPDSQLTEIITHGVEALAPDGYKSDMKGFGDRLSDRETKAVLAYIKTWWPEQARERQAQITEKADGKS